LKINVEGVAYIYLVLQVLHEWRTERISVDPNQGMHPDRDLH
jgi:hypothetical protein